MASHPVLIVAAAKDPFVAQLVRLLRSEGREVVVARQAEATIRMVRSRRPAVVILDAVLPDGDGLSLCRRLKESPEASDVPVFCYSVMMARDRSVEVGADGFMLKPLEQDLLLDRIREILDSRITPLPNRGG